MNARVSIRRAVPGDARALAEIHVASWRAAYRGLLSDAVLDAQSVERRAAQWHDWLTHPTTPLHRHHALLREGVPAGFAVTAPTRDDDGDEGVFELAALYLAPDAMGQGFGAMLLGVALGEAAVCGARTVTLWVLDTNTRARRFYERMGFVADGTEKHDARIDGRELRYRLDLA